MNARTALLLTLAPLMPLAAQQVVTTDGQVYPETSLRRSGQTLLMKVAGTGVEMGVPLTRISKVDFPEPSTYAKAREAAEAGKAAEVLGSTGDFVASQGEFRDVPGSWWPKMASLRLLALAASGRDAEAAALAKDLGDAGTPAARSLSKGGLLLGQLQQGDAVVAGAKGLPRAGGDQGSALAQFALGKVLLKKNDDPGALKAFLSITVFYPSCTLLQAPALQGAAEAYLGMKDTRRAAECYDRIVSEWPGSPQSREAAKKAAGLKGT
jgi:tetratricopeptide (TPR) repeat protein